MSNTTNATLTFTVGDTTTGTIQFNGSVNDVQTGSNITADLPNILNGSWQGLKTSSLSSMRWAVFVNNGTGSVKLAGTSAGAGINPILQPGDFCVIPLSGSISSNQLYAQSILANDSNLLYYGVQEI